MYCMILANLHQMKNTVIFKCSLPKIQKSANKRPRKGFYSQSIHRKNHLKNLTQQEKKCSTSKNKSIFIKRQGFLIKKEKDKHLSIPAERIPFLL